jgi:uncharacterized protein with HEPN domain
MKGEMGDKERLGHILDAIEFINKAIGTKTETDFQADFILHTAILKWLENIGEACYKLTRGFKSQHLEINWRLIEGLRHILVHEYFGIDLIRIWSVVINDLPALKMNVENLLKEFE